MRIRFTSVEQIQAHKFVGNFMDDAAAFNAIEAFVVDTKNSIADRAEALRILSDAGMGCGRDEDISDEKLVADFMHDDAVNQHPDPTDIEEMRVNEDTPSVQNCDDWGTGEGKYHGRM